MINFSVIRSTRQLDTLIAELRGRRLPFKIALQDVYAARSVQFNDYYWGFIVTPVAEKTGHSTLKVHEGFKTMFNYGPDFIYNKKTKRYEIVISAKTTTTMHWKDYWNYCLQCRAYAEIELSVTCLLPDEVFIPELICEAEL